MTNRTSLNQHAQNIRNQGSWASWVADIDEEIYQNIEQVEGQIASQQSQVSDIINSQLPAKQNVLNDHEQRLQSNVNQINQILNSELPAKQNVLNEHENRLQGQQNAINNINNDLSNKQNQINQFLGNDLPQLQNRVSTSENVLVEHSTKIAEFEEQIKTFNKDSVSLLGQYFKDTYTEFKKSSDYWLIGLGAGFVSVLLFDYKNLSGAGAEALKDSLWLLPINIFFFTILYFIASQYSHYKKLATDYKNREVVAISYLGIVNVAQTADSKDKITSIVADTLFSRNVADQGPDLPMKEAVRLIDAGASIAKR